MRDLDHQIRESLERLVDAGGDRRTDALWNDLVARRRRRRVRNGALAVLPVLLLGALAVGVVATRGSDGGRTDVATGRGGPDPGVGSESGAAGSLRVVRTRVVGNGPLVGGTERVVIQFNEPLPLDHVTYQPDIAAVDQADGMVFTTQGPSVTRVCDSRHSVPAGAVGSVDVLLPARWFAADAHEGPPPEAVDDPAKFVVCGPYNGFVQYAVWAPLSIDPADVTVAVSADRTTLTIQITSPGGSLLDPHAGQLVVAPFLDDLRAGDAEAAAARWTGYPDLGPDSSVAERVPYVEALLANPTFARILVSDTTTTFVTPSTDDAGQVVTVLDARSGEDPPAAIAFLTGWSAEQGDAGELWIHRLPLQEAATDAPELPAGSYAAPGQDIVVRGLPVEGGARAFVGEREIPVDVDHERFTMTVTIPADAEGDIAVTLVIASPELPAVRAFAVTVRP